MKFLVWFFALIVFFSSFFVAFAYNIHQTFLTPEKTKQVLVKVDFYNQIKSVLKKDLFETGNTDSAEVNNATNAIGVSFDQFNFQPKIETLISDFYNGLDHPDKFVLNIDLIDFKNVFLSNISASTDNQSANEISASIPNSWQVDMSQYSASLTGVAFIYHNYNLILIVYGILVLLFFIFCLLINFKYLRLFFWVFIIIGIFILLQLIFWKVVNLSSILAGIESQGRSGVSILVENFVDYFKQENIRLLFWESLYLIGPSLLGVIIVSVIPVKIGNVPLHEVKK
ncbi:MAG: hypothetical protein NTY30_04510 [Candidatus Berkelbacteria bacterium]|nr:hypothetical protein [Candidatus Berkelbacteria bacterium]